MAAYEEIYDKSNLTQVETERNNALSDLEKTYSGMISHTDQYYDKQIQESKDWADKQTELQNQQLALTEQKVEQQRAQAQKDYTKEQSGAYVDWQKQSNQYGANAEKMAAQGLSGTGYSESSQVRMYNAYQNRIATAREAFVQANLNYDNAIAEARLQNSTALAEIAHNAYQQQLELALQGFQYKNALISEQTDKKLQTKQYYSSEYQRVLDQINTQNALAHQQAQLQLERDKFDYQKEQDAKEQAAKMAQEIAKAKSAVKTVARGVGKVVGAKKNAFGLSGNESNSASATDYLNAMIASGADKNQVLSEITKAVKEGAITKEEAADLKKVFVPKGIQY